MGSRIPNHDFHAGPNGRCDADMGALGPCGYQEDADVHQAQRRSGSGLRTVFDRTIDRPEPEPSDTAAAQARRGRPWAELPPASKAILIFAGSGVAVVFAAAVAAAARWLLDIGGWL